MNPAALLFDLDGTLVDSAADLAAGVDRMCAALGLPPRGVAAVRDWVGKGIAVLVDRALAGRMEGGAPADLHARGLALFEEFYAEESGRHGTVFPGVMATLEELTRRGAKLACVTNKPERHTRPLLDQCGLAPFFSVVIGGDTLPVRKPHPGQLLEACRRFGAAPADTLMVGDSENDLAAGRAAGCPVVLVTYGYTEGRPVASLGADRLIGDLRELLSA